MGVFSLSLAGTANCGVGGATVFKGRLMPLRSVTGEDGVIVTGKPNCGEYSEDGSLATLW
ncbi:MAG: hypothetical protein NVS9B9_30870 [Ktedonobacteraceae bacterium]